MANATYEDKIILTNTHYAGYRLTTINGTHSAADQLNTIAGNAAANDLKGNLTAYEINGKEYEVEYDLDNCPRSAHALRNRISSSGNAGGELSMQTDAVTIKVEVDNDDVEHKHQAGQTVIQNDIMAHPSRLNSVIARAKDGSKFKLEWYHKNYLDHVYAVSDDSGDITEHYRYTAFGEVTIYNENGQLQNTTQIDNHILWNTRRRDEVTGYYMYKFRHYSAELGRWLGRDPIGEAGGVNLYGFVGNDPHNWWDVLGLDRHHWFIDDGGKGQASFNKKCPMLLGFDINDFTTELAAKNPGLHKNVPHGYVHHVLKYNALYKKIMNGSGDCCRFMMAMYALMSRIHIHLKGVNNTIGFGHGTSYNPATLELVNYTTGNNTTAKLLPYIKKACRKRCKKRRDYVQESLQAELYVETVLTAIELIAARQVAYEEAITGKEEAITDSNIKIEEINKKIESIQESQRRAALAAEAAMRFWTRGRKGSPIPYRHRPPRRNTAPQQQPAPGKVIPMPRPSKSPTVQPKPGMAV